MSWFLLPWKLYEYLARGNSKATHMSFVTGSAGSAGSAIREGRLLYASTRKRNSPSRDNEQLI